jgi:hypothetical protein
MTMVHKLSYLPDYQKLRERISCPAGRYDDGKIAADLSRGIRNCRKDLQSMWVNTERSPRTRTISARPGTVWGTVRSYNNFGTSCKLLSCPYPVSMVYISFTEVLLNKEQFSVLLCSRLLAHQELKYLSPNVPEVLKIPGNFLVG